MRLFRCTPKPVPATIVISGHASVYLVGTERYPAEYARAEAEQPVYLELDAETDNPHDPLAVAGLVDGRVAGHLPREVSAKYHAPLLAAKTLGFRIVVATEYRVRNQGDMGMGWLDMPNRDALIRWLELPEDERARGFDFPAGKSPNTPRSVGTPLVTP
jgi:hypothetical protein